MKHRLIFLYFLVIQVITLRAQYSMGMMGQMNIPTADMQPAGTFMGGGNFLPKQLHHKGFDYNTWNYFVNMTFFSFLEINYKCTLQKTYYMTNKAKFNNQDRSFSAKIRLLKEKKYYPAIAFGVNDPYEHEGMNYYASVYGIVTKNILPGKQHELSLSLGYYHPLNDYSIQNGIFGGLRYTPAFLKPLSVMAEYDSAGFNIGAAAKLWNRVSLHLFTREFKCISGGMRYEFTLIH